jgi:hypothetical protein
LAYAVQWFIFSICVAIGWVLAVRRSVATRRHRAPTSPAQQPDTAIDTEPTDVV